MSVYLKRVADAYDALAADWHNLAIADAFEQAIPEAEAAGCNGDQIAAAMRKRTVSVGWFDRPSQTEPTHDPGIDGVACPLCGAEITEEDVRTYSVCGGSKSVFYRTHRTCAEDATEAAIRALDQRAMQAVRD